MGWLITSISFMLGILSFVMLALVAPDWIKLYTLPTSWALSMIVGGVFQLGFHRYKFRWPTNLLVRFPLVLIASVFLGLLTFYPNLKAQQWIYCFGALSIGFAGAILIMELKGVHVIQPWAKPLLWLGKISYAAYLWNFPITAWIQETKNPYGGLLSIIFTLFAATISWYLIEKPVNGLKEGLQSRSDKKTKQQTLEELK